VSEENAFGRIDVHNHLIPGVDDGCRTLDDSVACARALVEAGYTHAFCTPHIWPSLPRNTIDNIRSWTRELQDEFDKRSVPLKLIPGGEINLNARYQNTPADRVVTYGMAGKYAIFDLWAETLPPHFEPAVKWLQSLGLTVILAHPERMRAVQEKPELADYFTELGLLMQGNLQCFADALGTATRVTAERFLKEDRYFVLGSDCHNRESLDVRLRGLKNAIRLAGDETIDRLTRENPRKLVPDFSPFLF
jgi:protein-tyrosine phosphatase